MEAIINLWHKQLHEIIISTKNGRKLRLDMNQSASGYRLEGEFYEPDHKAWYQVEFSSQNVSDPNALLKCIKGTEGFNFNHPDSL